MDLNEDINCITEKQKFLDGKDITEDIRKKALSLCQTFVSGPWIDVDDHEIQFRKVSGGLSNNMFYCSVPDRLKTGDPKCQVLIRICGRFYDSVGCEVNTVVNQLIASQGLGPKMFGVFSGGRIEEYIPSKTLTTADLRHPVFSKAIARKLATFHYVEPPISKTPHRAFLLMNKNLEEIRRNLNINKLPEAQQLIANQLLNYDLESEIQWLQKSCAKIHSPTVFCHNDLNNGNILARNSVWAEIEAHPELSSDPRTLDDLIVLVDFELCSYNYRGFDIGRHFTDYCYDYSPGLPPPGFVYVEEDYPGEEEQRRFVREYLAKLREIKQLSEWDTEEHLMKEVAVYRMVHNLFWTIFVMRLSVDWASLSTEWIFAISKSRFEIYQQNKIDLNKI